VRRCRLQNAFTRWRKYKTGDYEVDHLIPLSLGGSCPASRDERVYPRRPSKLRASRCCQDRHQLLVRCHPHELLHGDFRLFQSLLSSQRKPPPERMLVVRLCNLASRIERADKSLRLRLQLRKAARSSEWGQPSVVRRVFRGKTCQVDLPVCEVDVLESGFINFCPS
jgi:hypothetical protein